MQIVVDELLLSGGVRTTFQPYRTLRILPQFIWGFLLTEGIDIVEKLLTRTEMLCDICEVNASTTTAEADSFDDLISEELPKARSGWKIINTGTIDPYRALWGVAPFSSGGQKLLRPYLHDDRIVISDYRREQYSSQKLIFAKVALSLEVVFDANEEFASSNTNFAFVGGQEGFFYLGILNSTLLSWIYEQYFGALRMGGGYMQFQAPQLRCLPVPRFDSSNEQMARLAEAASAHRDKDNSELLREIDTITYALYGLSEDDVLRVTVPVAQDAGGENE
jgi:hypothetical protein